MKTNFYSLILQCWFFTKEWFHFKMMNKILSASISVKRASISGSHFTEMARSTITHLHVHVSHAYTVMLVCKQLQYVHSLSQL